MIVEGDLIARIGRRILIGLGIAVAGTMAIGWVCYTLFFLAAMAGAIEFDQLPPVFRLGCMGPVLCVMVPLILSGLACSALKPYVSGARLFITAQAVLLLVLMGTGFAIWFAAVLL